MEARSLSTMTPEEKYGAVEVVEADHTMTHLWRVEVPADAPAKPPKAERLTEGDRFSVGAFSWSPDGKRVAFSAARNPNFSDADTADVYVLTVADKAVKKLVDTAGPDRNPFWSPDGKQVAYETADGNPFFYYTNARVAVVPAEGGKPRVVTPDFDEHPGLAGWGPDGIYFSALQKTARYLYRLDPERKTAERVGGPNALAFTGYSFSADFKRAAFLHAAPNEFPEVCATPLDSFAPKPLTTFGEQRKGFRLGTKEVIEWKSTDGTTIEGVLTKPADFDSSKKHPLLVVIHGGPTGIDTPARGREYAYPLERFAAKGALILQPNYRGSAGYGEKFRSLNVRNLGLGDYADVLSGVDHLVGQGLADPDRVGAMGWSQGGYISAFITTYSDRFKAVSVGAGISDWMTYYVNTDIHPFTRQYLKATPWDDPEIYRKTSPISYLKTAKTPTLIQHGDRDARVPVPNAFQLYRGLKDRGVPTKLVLFKGFGHGIDKPKEQRALMEQNEEWFAEYVWGEKPGRKAADANWPSFRGPNASGVADGFPTPTTWDAEKMENVLWRTPIPGLAHSSPVVWGDRVFVTTAVNSDDKTEFKKGQFGSGASADDLTKHAWRVYCLDRKTGKVLWERTAHEGVPRVKRHVKASHANATPAVDGHRLVVLLGSEGLFCFDHDGNLRWKVDLGVFDTGAFDVPTLQWGPASSPVLYKGLVFVQCDMHKDSFLAAHDVVTGKQVWRTPREELPSWSTPTVVEGPTRVELVTSAPNYTRGYDPLTGKELWRLGGHSKITTPAPVAAHGLIFVADGYSRPGIKPIYAVRPGASGDITLKEDEEANEHVAWSKKRGAPYTPTPVVYGDFLYACTNGGVLTCYEAKTGRQVYEQRLDGASGFSASPVAADGKLYFPSEDGDILVVRAGPTFELLATNRMGDACLATPAISGGVLLVRTRQAVWALGR